MFVEKVVALMGEVPEQFNPVLYAISFIAFLWVFDTFTYVFRSFISR